jgi:hypothetical protein
MGSGRDVRAFVLNWSSSHQHIAPLRGAGREVATFYTHSTPDGVEKQLREIFGIKFSPRAEAFSQTNFRLRPVLRNGRDDLSAN